MAEDLKNEGNRELKAGNFEKAIFFYKEAIEMDPTNAIYYNNKGLALLKLGKNEKALMAANDAIRLQPSWFKGYSTKGTALYNLGRFDDCIQAYKDGLVRDPDNASLKERLLEAQRNSSSSNSSSSGTTSSTTPGTVKFFLWGAPGAKRKTMIASLRLFAILNGLFSILPFLSFPGCWFRLIVSSIILRALTLMDTHGTVKLNKEYLQKTFLDASGQNLLFCLLSFSLRPSFLAVFVIISSDLIHAAYFAQQYLSISSPETIEELNKQINTYAKPYPKFVAAKNKWVLVSCELVRMSAQFEIMITFTLVLGLVFGGRNMIGLFSMYNYLKMRYATSSDSQVAFQTIDRQVIALTRHHRCPAFLGTTYMKIRGFIGRLAIQSPTSNTTENTGPPSLMSRCVVM